MQIVRKISALLLMVIYLCSATAVHELFKLPVLAVHFYDHKQENTASGLISFLVNHYLVEDGTDKDAAEDRQLPFKSVENGPIVTFISITPPSNIIIVSRPEYKSDKSFGAFVHLFLPSQYLASIWQPPRSC